MVKCLSTIKKGRNQVQSALQYLAFLFNIAAFMLLLLLLFSIINFRFSSYLNIEYSISFFCSSVGKTSAERSSETLVVSSRGLVARPINLLKFFFFHFRK